LLVWHLGEAGNENVIKRSIDHEEIVESSRSAWQNHWNTSVAKYVTNCDDSILDLSRDPSWFFMQPRYEEYTEKSEQCCDNACSYSLKRRFDEPVKPWSHVRQIIANHIDMKMTISDCPGLGIQSSLNHCSLSAMEFLFHQQSSIQLGDLSRCYARSTFYVYLWFSVSLGHYEIMITCAHMLFAFIYVYVYIYA
jgi:hypothetical protein